MRPNRDLSDVTNSAVKKLSWKLKGSLKKKIRFLCHTKGFWINLSDSPLKNGWRRSMAKNATATRPNVERS
jgi:hypothetical protein